MSYKKSLKGDSNQANEEFSHNRITIVAGGAGVILVCFVCCLVLAAIVWMIARQGALFSLLIILSFLAIFSIGMAVLFALGLSFVVERISFMVREVRVNRILGTTVIAGEVVSHYDGEEWTHLSSIHEQGKVTPQLQISPPEHEPLPSEAFVVLDMHRQGIGFKAIAESTQWTEYAVRKLCNQADGKTTK